MTFKAIDKFFITYNVLVLALILLFGSGRSDFFVLIGWHLTLMGLVLVLTAYDAYAENTLSDFLRYAYPALLLGLIHYESGILSPLVTEGYFDSLFIDLDRFLFGADLYTWLAPNIGGPLISEIMNGAYFSFYLMILGILLGTYILKRQHTGEMIFAFIVCMYTQYFFFILFPVIGPTHWRAEIFTGQEGLISAFVYSLIENGDSAGGAFPSSHCAGAFLLNWYAWRIFGKRIGLILVPVTVLLFISSVYLAMHYLIDSVVGILVGWLFAVYGSTLYRRLSSATT